VRDIVKKEGFSMVDYDLIIIGGGPAGLTAAIRMEWVGLRTWTREAPFLRGGELYRVEEGFGSSVRMIVDVDKPLEE
jgi:succinate dehydrogenase/fumarate reductase flavoprotein subunit